MQQMFRTKILKVDNLKKCSITIFILFSSNSYCFPAHNFSSFISASEFLVPSHPLLFQLGFFLFLLFAGMVPAEGLCFCS